MVPALHVLVVENETPTALAIDAALQDRGHRVTHFTSAEEALALAARDVPDVVVCDLDLGPGMDGLALLGELRERGSAARAVLLSGLPTLEDCRRAMRLGAAELLALPLQPGELAEAVEAGDPPPALPTAQAVWTFRRTMRADLEATECCVRGLAAFLLRSGLGPSTRARVATACAEVFENAVRHAYADEPGPVSLAAELGDGELVVSIRDEGAGFVPSGAFAGPQLDPALSGLARAGALAEDLRVESALGGGTHVELRFVASRATFDQDDVLDLSELDWFSPGLARRVLEALGSERADVLFNLSPALAVSIGRMLTAPTAEQRAQQALWS